MAKVMFTFTTIPLTINIFGACIVKTSNIKKYLIIGESCFLLTQVLLVQMHVLFFLSILFDRKSETLQSYFKRPFKRMTVTANHIL